MRKSRTPLRCGSSRSDAGKAGVPGNRGSQQATRCSGASADDRFVGKMIGKLLYRLRGNLGNNDMLNVELTGAVRGTPFGSVAIVGRPVKRGVGRHLSGTIRTNRPEPMSNSPTTCMVPG
jgi:hypothetical protein